MKETLTLIKKTYKYYGKIIGYMILCVIIGLTRVGILLVEPQIASLFVDKVINPALGAKPVDNSSFFMFLIEDIDPTNLWAIMGILSFTFLALMGVYFVTFYARWNIIHYVSTKVENEMRADILKKINDLGPKVLKYHTNGELITIANSDTSTIKFTYIANAPFIIDSLFYIIVAAVLLSRTSYLLMIVPMCTFIIYLFITRGFIKMSNQFYDEMWKKNSSINTEAQESIYGIRTIKAYAREKYRFKRFSDKSEDLRNFYIKFNNRKYKYFMLYDSMDQILMVISMIISIWLASNLKMTSGEYTGFLAYLLMMVGNFVDIIFLLGDVQMFKVSAKRVFGLLDIKDDVAEKYGSEDVGCEPHIEFSNVTVHTEEKDLIKNVSIDIPYGSKIGVMGKTGSGKSVFLKVMQGFTDFTEGKITIDNKSIYDYGKVEVARAFSYAMQDVFLFSNSISSNIAFYDPLSDNSKVEECGRLTAVDEFVDNFPEGYETVVGEKGFGLSGGQKQRVAIARALYKDAPVIVLDDCTSALDMDTEAKIFENLHSSCDSKTLVMATHRAPALKNCDEIIFFEDGEIVERGNFDELMKLGGRYASIYNHQVGNLVG